MQKIVLLVLASLCTRTGCLCLFVSRYVHTCLCAVVIGWRVVLGEVQSPIRAHRTTHQVLRNHSDVTRHTKKAYMHMQTQARADPHVDATRERRGDPTRPAPACRV